MLLSAKENDKETDMTTYYKSHYPIIFLIVGISIMISILFNIIPLKKPLQQQILLLLFIISTMWIAFKKFDNDLVHKAIALIICSASVLSVVL
ncbi:MAG: hypothetical protein ACKVOM_00245 [Ferruginibacter sp.]